MGQETLCAESIYRDCDETSTPIHTCVRVCTYHLPQLPAALGVRHSNSGAKTTKLHAIVVTGTGRFMHVSICSNTGLFP